MRRVLNQAANAAVKAKDAIFASCIAGSFPDSDTPSDQRNRPPAVSSDLEDPHEGIRYEERGPAVTKEAKQARTRKTIRELPSLGYQVELASPALPA